ncbi:unnamed protein product [Cuscuta epithymum]|uniref:Uncharacterized protein n=1 Tax=Cuscuta epithymum TaxID=186058 RepID=A0AAV0G478_9ASTE|nr:unnamed protein product [Cuscuta epithymum]CAH9142544.1 unnamed protein product [Cuscuta epithymum]
MRSQPSTKAAGGASSSSSSRGTATKLKTTPCCAKVGLKRGPWTPEEDEVLSEYVKREGEGRWRTLPKKAGLLRCGKSCRLRWMNYLRPSVKRGHIAADEEDLIIRLHRLLGNRWSLIAGRIPGRTDNEIKNYWNTHLSKKLISQGIDPRTHRPLITTTDGGGGRPAANNHHHATPSPDPPPVSYLAPSTTLKISSNNSIINDQEQHRLPPPPPPPPLPLEYSAVKNNDSNNNIDCLSMSGDHLGIMNYCCTDEYVFLNSLINEDLLITDAQPPPDHHHHHDIMVPPSSSSSFGHDHHHQPSLVTTYPFAAQLHDHQSSFPFSSAHGLGDGFQP